VSILTDVLDFSEIESRKLELESVDVSAAPNPKIKKKPSKPIKKKKKTPISTGQTNYHPPPPPPKKHTNAPPKNKKKWRLRPDQRRGPRISKGVE